MYGKQGIIITGISRVGYAMSGLLIVPFFFFSFSFFRRDAFLGWKRLKDFYMPNLSVVYTRKC